MDLSKAFHKLSYILPKMLPVYGIEGVALSCFKEYLSFRHQYVVHGSSEYLTIKYGVPQGLILGPLILLFYLNDRTNASPLLSFLLHVCLPTTSTFFS